VERLVHLGAGPASGDAATVDHLLQDAGPSAGGVLLLPRRLVGGTHDAGARSRQTLADAGASVDGGPEVPAVVQQGEPAPTLPSARLPAASHAAQVRVE